MLGPALSQLQGDLAAIPQAERTIQQQALFHELSLLSEAEAQISPILSKVNAFVDTTKLGFFSITRPLVPDTFTRPDPGSTRCNRCGQYFPVSTQPKA